MGKGNSVLSKREIKPPKRYEDDNVDFYKNEPRIQQGKPRIKVGSKANGKSVSKVSQEYICMHVCMYVTYIRKTTYIHGFMSISKT